MHRIVSVVVFTIVLGQALVAHAAISPLERNNLRYACEASGQISGAEVDGRWCQCMNDYYLDTMTTADWTKYSQDYYALQALQNVQSEANSYTRILQVGQGHCIKCKNRNYQGCLKGDEQIAQYNDILENLTAGQFQSVEKDMTYKLFYTDFIRTYSQQCSALIRDGVIDTFVYDDPVLGSGGSITRIEQKFLNSYDRYVEEVSMNFWAEFGRKTGEAMTTRNPLVLMDIGFDVVSRNTFMNQQFAGKCTTPEVRALHDNIERFDKGLSSVNPQTPSRSTASTTASKRAEIFAYTKASYNKAAAAYAKVNQNYEGLNCPRRQKEATTVIAPRSPSGDDLKDLEGAWSGSFYGEPVELAMWHIQRTPEMNPWVGGILYFSERKCTIFMNLQVYGQPARAVVEAGPRPHPTDCMSVTNAEPGKGGYGFNGDYALKDGKPTLLLTLIQYLLSSNASCSANAPSFTRANASPAFIDAIKGIQAARDPNMSKPTPQQLSKMIR